MRNIPRSKLDPSLAKAEPIGVSVINIFKSGNFSATPFVLGEEQDRTKPTMPTLTSVRKELGGHAGAAIPLW